MHKSVIPNKYSFMCLKKIKTEIVSNVSTDILAYHFRPIFKFNIMLVVYIPNNDATNKETVVATAAPVIP